VNTAASACPSASAPSPIGRSRACSPAPIAALTRRLAAIDSPSENINVVDTHEIAIWCAARGSAPSQPIITAEAANAPLSNSSIPAAGRPRCSISRK